MKNFIIAFLAVFALSMFTPMVGIASDHSPTEKVTLSSSDPVSCDVAADFTAFNCIKSDYAEKPISLVWKSPHVKNLTPLDKAQINYKQLSYQRLSNNIYKPLVIHCRTANC